MKALKKLICIISALVIIVLAVVPSLAVDISELTYLYLDKGNIVIGDGAVSGYGYFGEPVTLVNENGYCITLSKKTITNVTNTVVINGGDNHITLKSLNSNLSTSDFSCAFAVQNGAKLDLFFTGDNTLISSSARAGLEISSDSEVTISGDGTLRCASVGQAGIGGGGGGSNGTVIINSGTIIAQCGRDNSAGIGGGSSGAGGNIIINGGNITATAGRYGAGIGGGCSAPGGNIVINGGTVTAAGGENGAGIGGGWYGEMGNITINGGSVKAVAGTNAPAIGSGNNAQNVGSAVNSEGEDVYPFTFPVSNVGSNGYLYVNGKPVSVCGIHEDDENYYFYAPVGSSFVAVENNNDTVIYKADVLSSGSSSLVSVNPIQAINGAQIGTDNIIRGISCGLTDLNDYLSCEEGYSLSYDNEYIGTGTGVVLMYGNVPVYKYRALLYGDVNNDGFYDGEDSFLVVCILCGMLNRNNSDTIIFEAADADRNGTISEDDVLLLEQAGLMRSDVAQTDDVISFDSAVYDEYISLIDQTPMIETDAEITDEDIVDDFKAEKKMSFLDFIKSFIKNAIKVFMSVRSFWKKYFI